MDAIGQWLSQNAIGLLALVLTPFLAWFFNRRTQNATAAKTDAEGTEIIVNASGKLVTSWQGLYDEIKEELDASNQKNTKLIETNNKLIEQNNILINQNLEVKQQNESLKKQNQILSAQMTDAVSKVKEYGNQIQQLFVLIISDLDTTNPDLAKKVRESFAEISKLINE